MSKEDYAFNKVAKDIGKVMFNIKNKCEICEREVKPEFQKCFTCNMKEKNPDAEFVCRDCNKKVKDGFMRCYGCKIKNDKKQQI